MMRCFYNIVAILPLIWFLFDYSAYQRREREAAMEPIRQYLAAARRGDLATVQNYWAKGVPINTVGPDGRNALQLAVARGNAPMVLFLLDHGAQPDSAANEMVMTDDIGVLKAMLASGESIAGQRGYYALCYAAQRNNPKLVDFLLRQGVSSNIHLDTTSAFNQESPLLRAARYGSWDTFQLLASHGADLSARSRDGRTALMLAAFSNAPDSARICRYLIQHKADINAYDDYGTTALTFAQQSGNSAVAALLRR